MIAANPMDVLLEARTAGLHLSANAGQLVVESDLPNALTNEWRTRLREHKAALLELLSSDHPPPLTDEDEEAIREARDERAAIMEFDGGLSRADAEEQARAAMRVYRYKLTDCPPCDPAGTSWCTAILPGFCLEAAREHLANIYGADRVVEVVEHRPGGRLEAES